MNKDLNDVSHRLVFSLLGGEYTLRKDSILVFVLMLHYHRVNDSKFCPSFYSRDLLQTDAGKRRRGNEGHQLPGGGGVSIMPGTGQSISNVRGIAAAIKVYDGGVESGDLTLRLVRD